MDEELVAAMLVTIRAMFETSESTLDEFVDAFVRERPDLLERYGRALALRQLRTMLQGLLDVCVAKAAEEIRARGWKAGKA
jgi:hypothetical protein